MISTENLIEIVTRLHMEFTNTTKMKIPIEILPSFAVNLSDKQLHMKFERREQTVVVSDLNDVTGDSQPEVYDQDLMSARVDNDSSHISPNSCFAEAPEGAEITKVKNTITVITS